MVHFMRNTPTPSSALPSSAASASANDYLMSRRSFVSTVLAATALPAVAHQGRDSERLVRALPRCRQADEGRFGPTHLKIGDDVKDRTRRIGRYWVLMPCSHVRA